MTNYRTYSLIVFILLSGLSCTKSSLFNEGEIRTENRSIPDFTYLEINDIFDITIKQSNTPGVEITCGDRLIQGIETYYRNDTLIITDNNHLDWTRKYRKIELVILTNSMQKICLIAPCNLKTDGVYKQDYFALYVLNNLTQADISIETGYFYFVNSWINTGNYKINGESQSSYLWLNGSAILDASELIVEEMYVEQRSIGDMMINVSNQLEYNIKNSGNIISTGIPSKIIESVHSGTGELIFIE